MASFDPYRKWLGIPIEEQPPDHYRLLGIGLFESDPDVIANAADRQMMHVRSFQGGKYVALSQRILNELSAARVCLLDPHQRAAYDAKLKATLTAHFAAAHPVVPPGSPPTQPPTGPPPAEPPSLGTPPGSPPSGAAPPPAQPAPVVPIRAGMPATRPRSTRRRSNDWQVATIALGVLAVGALAMTLLLATGATDQGAPNTTPPRMDRSVDVPDRFPALDRRQPPARNARSRRPSEPAENASEPSPRQAEFSRATPSWEAAAAAPAVPRQPTPRAQWFFATTRDTEEAWRAVIEYFPMETHLVRRAKQQLARICLLDGRYEEALALFDELAALGETEAEFRAFGLAGRGSVLMLQGKHEQSARVLDELFPTIDHLRDRQMRQLVSAAVRRNREQLGSQSAQQWSDWLQQQMDAHDAPDPE